MHRPDAAVRVPPGLSPTAGSSRRDDWQHRQLDRLVASIARQEHAWLRSELRRLELELEAQLPVQRGCHFELQAVQADFVELTALIRPHLVRKETILFPLVTALAQRRSLGGLYDSLAQPVATLLQDHHEIAARVELLEGSTLRLVEREVEEGSIRHLTAGLQSLCATLRAQMRREEEYLYPRVTALEACVQGDTCIEGGT